MLVKNHLPTSTEFPTPFAESSGSNHPNILDIQYGCLSIWNLSLFIDDRWSQMEFLV